MHNLNRVSKFFLYTAVLSGSLWLGGYLMRLLVTYQLFQPKDFLLKYYVTAENLPGIIITLNPAIVFTLSLFPVFIITFAAFLLTSKIKLRQEGWLFIIILIILVTAPFEFYLMTIDLKTSLKVLGGNFHTDEVLALYIKRNKVLSSFPLIEIFSYCSIVFLAVIKPLRMKKQG